MDSRATIRIAITAKRRHILELFMRVLNETVWSRLQPLAAFQDREKIAKDTATLTPESSTDSIAPTRSFLDARAKYWDKNNINKRAVLIALFDINVLLIGIHKKVEQVNPVSLADLLAQLEGHFTVLKMPEKDYSNLISRIQPIFETLTQFQANVVSDVARNTLSIAAEEKEGKEEKSKPDLPASSIECSQTSSITLSPTLSATSLQAPDALHPTLALVLKHRELMKKALGENPNLPTEANLKRRMIANDPLIKVANQAIRKLNQLIQVNPSLPTGKPKLKKGSRTLKDYYRYFNEITSWAQNNLTADKASLESDSVSQSVAVVVPPVASPKIKTSADTASDKKEELKTSSVMTYSPLSVQTIRWKLDQLVLGNLSNLKNALSLCHGAKIKSAHFSGASKIGSLIELLTHQLMNSSPRSATSHYDAISRRIYSEACILQSGPDLTIGTEKIRCMAQSIHLLATLKTKLDGFAYPSYEILLPVIPHEPQAIDQWSAAAELIIDNDLKKLSDAKALTASQPSIDRSLHRTNSFDHKDKSSEPLLESKQAIFTRPAKKSDFWSRHPYLKWGLIGLTTGIIAAGTLFMTGIVALSIAGACPFIGVALFAGGRKIFNSYCQPDYGNKPSEISLHTPHATPPDHKISIDPPPADISPKTRSAPPALSPRAQGFIIPSEVKAKEPHATQEDIYKAMKALICPDDKTEQSKLLQFWKNSVDKKDNFLKQNIMIDKHNVVLPESIACLASLIMQALSVSQKITVSTLAMQHKVMQKEAIKANNDKEIFKITGENLADALTEHGYKKTICTILAYRYANIAEKVHVLRLLLEAIKHSPEYNATIQTPEHIADAVALRAALGARAL